ncbi:MAG: UvrD-helicase domain-containing protein [Candidatus Methanoculleus thermohydrogenotrophicum]|jgi:ATP-dependent helicase/nuclease subunit A|nr:UvrD-helicase domain-containing protein [Candidatus Methanoculleus thermohydrogenotrophicum]
MGLTDRQRQAALDHGTSKCVTAGAGTGKTHVLVRKYVDLLESKDGPGVAGILALTFTEKAAQQMRERVRDAVAKKKGPGWDAVRDDLLWANISTFHAFCARVLREFPLEAGVEPGFSVLDEREAERLREEEMDNLIYGEPSEACRDALICTLRAIGAHELKRYLSRLYEKRAAAEEFFAALERDEGAVLEAWQEILRQRKEKVVQDFLMAARPKIEVLADCAARYPGEADSAMAYLRAIEPHLSLLKYDQPAEEVCRAVAAIAAINADRRYASRMGRKAHWDERDLDAVREAYLTLYTLTKACTGTLRLSIDPDDAFTRATLDFLHSLGTVFSAFSEAVDAAKARRGALDFSDLILYTHRLFRDRDDIVEAHFRSRFEFILVDEFQDTDSAQVAIIAAILGELAAERGKLFVVGDPKQSIYLFRDADVTLFKRTRNVIEEMLGGEEVCLDVNFRSTPEVVGFVNFVFSTLMAESARPWEFAYEPLRASRIGDVGSVEILLCPKAATRAAGCRASAEAVARKVQQMVEAGEKPVYRDGDCCPAGYGDIAILLERRTNLIYYEWALRRYGIPYHVYAGLGFYQRQEVYDLYNILRFLENERDDVALYGALRSPYFGISDARLFAVADSGPRSATLWKRLRRFASGAHESDVAAAAAILESWQGIARRLRPAELLNRVVTESGVYAVYGGMPEGEQVIANVEKLIGIVRDLQEGGSSLGEIVGELELCIDGEEREGEAQPDLASSDTVAVMTVHASKGLEFPVVVVPDLSEPPLPDTSTIIIEEGLRLGVRIPDPENNHERVNTPILAVLKDEAREKDEAERKRLFYVALTRARDHLVLCGVMPDAVPESVAACRTRTDWLTFCLGLCDDVYAAGSVEILPPGEDRPLRIRVCTAPDMIPAEIRTAAPHHLTVPEDLAPAAVERPLTPAAPLAEEGERVYSVSEIERYLRGQEEVEDDARLRGLIIHEVFQGRDPEVVLRRYGVDDVGLAREYARLYEEFLRSPMVQGAESDFCEVPFRARVGGVVFTGFIDRLLQRPDGTWVLVDYKTGHVDEESLPERVQEHALQVAVYRRAAEGILGRPVGAYLYFTDTGHFVEVPADEDAGVLEMLQQAIRGLEGLLVGD